MKYLYYLAFGGSLLLLSYEIPRKDPVCFILAAICFASAMCIGFQVYLGELKDQLRLATAEYQYWEEEYAKHTAEESRLREELNALYIERDRLRML